MRSTLVRHLHGGNSRSCEVGQAAASLPQEHCRLDRPCRSFRKERRGAAVVEFAIVAPVFFLFVLGIIEYGRMVMVYQMLTNSSRMGARMAVLEGTTEQEVSDAIASHLNSLGVSGETVTVTAWDQQDPPQTINLSDAVNGDTVEVSVSITFDQVSWLPSPMFLGGKELSASTQMRREGG